MKIGAIAIEGIDELEKQLDDLGREVATKLGHKAFRASAELLQQAWISGAPVSVKRSEASLKYGRLRDNIRVGRVRPQNQNAIVYKVTTGDAFWGHIVEFGGAHAVAHPWARPIVERMRDDLINVQVSILKDGIEAIAKKGKGRRGK